MKQNCEECDCMFFPLTKRGRFCCRKCGQKNWYQKNSARLKRKYADPKRRKKYTAFMRKWIPANRDRVRAYGRKHYAHNREAINMRQREKAKSLSDTYLRNLITNYCVRTGIGSPGRTHHFPPALLAAKRKQLELKRALIQIKNEN